MHHHGFQSLRGYLPQQDPLKRLPGVFDEWEQAAIALPKLLLANDFRQILEHLKSFPVDHLRNERETRRAMVLLSFLGAAYVWHGADPAATIPANLGQPWHEVATKLGRPPILSYASYCLDNWYRIDKSRPPELGNMALIQNFGGGVDEEWFILVHVEIEYRAGAALAAIGPCQEAIAGNSTDTVSACLSKVADGLSEMVRVLRCMPENCDPYVYYQRVRPYLHGWRDHPNLPDGVVYEGVEALHGKPQRWRGETGAQSSIVPVLDALLGITHPEDPLRHFLNEMREYMPPEHQAIITRVENGPNVRDFVQAGGRSSLQQIYDRCVRLLHEFRSIHLEYAAAYIARQAASSASNPVAVGTGGTPFMHYLAKHRKDTIDHQLAPTARRVKPVVDP